MVRDNLKNAFPDKSDKEINTIERKFFRYFCDLTLETLKSLTISPTTLAKRVSFEGADIFESYYKEGQSVIVVLGHFGNWELGGARYAIEPFHQMFVIYHPLQNKYYDRLVYHMRTRLGNGLYSMKNSLRGIIGNRNKVTAAGFIADQKPPRKGAHWMTFLNQDTPFFTGTGKIATKMNYPVIYTAVHRPRRGYYEMKAEVLVENSTECTDVEIVELFANRLEKDIIMTPELWLWSHNRWKHKREIIK